MTGADAAQLARLDAGLPAGFSDAARRVSDAVTMHILGGNAGRWLAFRLSDGGSDGVLYDTRADAVAHQLHETQCMYVKIPPDGMPPRHAEVLLKVTRGAYDAGFRLSDPEDPRHLIMPWK